MSEPARSRFALDLDDLERQLRGAAQPPKPGSTVDPLVELTRIVGQDDPLKDLFATRQGQGQANGYAQVHGQAHGTMQMQAQDQRPPAPQAAGQSWQQGRVEPSLSEQPEPEQAAPAAELRGALDEFEALLRRTEPTRSSAQPVPPALQHPYVPETRDDGFYAPADARHGEAGPRDLDEAAPHGHGYDAAYDRPAENDYPEPPEYAESDVRPYEAPRSRKGLWTALALLGVAVAGAGVAMSMRGGQPSADGLPPVIAADTGPTKVAPVNPGGAEIPNQNKQIYERAGDAATDKTKVVTREEQPVDVQQAARMMPPRVVLPGPGTGTATSPDVPQAAAEASAASVAAAAAAEPGLVPMPAVPGLGEPRRVRTVSIKPDGTPAGNGATEQASSIVTGSAPASQASAPARPRTNGQSMQVASADSAVASTPERSVTPAAPTTPPARPRVAAVQTAPTTPAPASPAAAAAPPAAAAPRTDAAGGFVVQLAAPGSESEARATFAALQRKYPDQLSGQSPIVRKTDLAAGKTVYRLRVGPYSREDATTMCTRLQSAGGQCFIAKN